MAENQKKPRCSKHYTETIEMNLLKLPVIRPNTSADATIVACKNADGEDIGYPSDTQIFLHVSSQHIILVTPATEETSYIYLVGNPTAHLVQMTADAVAEAINRHINVKR